MTTSKPAVRPSPKPSKPHYDTNTGEWDGQLPVAGLLTKDVLAVFRLNVKIWPSRQLES